jgi:hypothetical protein
MPDELPARNLEMAKGLRELADLLEAHPGMPEVRALVWVSDYRYGDDAGARARLELTAVAEALGARASEDRQGDRVRIKGSFGPVDLHADATVSQLRGAPPDELAYEPIIARDRMPVTPQEDEAWAEREARETPR